MPPTAAEPGIPHDVRFSVVIPTYNRASILPRAVRSVLAQTFDGFELVIVDDGSDDDTPEVVRSFADPRICFLRRENGGVSSARNAGAAVARGEYLVFLDSDDELLPEALARYAELDERADLVVSAVVKVSPDLLRWRTVTPDRERVRRRASARCSRGIRATHRRVPELRGLRRGVALQREHRARVATPRSPRRRGCHRRPRDTAGHRVQPAGSRHDEARYESARHILDRRLYEQEIEPGNGAARREFRANYLAIAAVGAARTGARREALGLAVRAIAADPMSPAR